jgi:type II secretory pathway pseudopilin PulG
MHNKVIKNTLVSSTLVEVLVGMTIIMITMSVVLHLTMKSQHELGVVQQSRAALVGASLMQKTRVLQDIQETEYEAHQLTIQKIVEKDIVHQQLYTVTIRITNAKSRELYLQSFRFIKTQ